MGVRERCMLQYTAAYHSPPVAHGFHLSTLRFTAHYTDDWTGDNILFYLLHLHLLHLQRFAHSFSMAGLHFYTTLGRPKGHIYIHITTRI